MTVLYLDSVPILESKVGYGELGLHGNLGYESKKVTVHRREYQHSLSTHPPARLSFRLDKPFSSLSCQVAMNDDVPAGRSHADFVVMADGREVAVEPYVCAGEPPRTLVADISNAEHLELLVRTSRWEHAHAVWLDPLLDEAPAPVTKLFDCLGRAEMTLPRSMLSASRCIATVVSPGFENLLDDMLGSLLANGRCQDALLLIFVLDGNEGCDRIVAKYNAIAVQCRSRSPLNPMSKSLLYSTALVVNARQYLFLDADMLVLGDLRPVFAALDALPEGKILVCREGNSLENNHLGRSLPFIYGGGSADLRRLEVTSDEEHYSLIVNDGLFAGDRSALLALDGTIRAMPQATTWVDAHPRVAWRNQFIFNLALARLQCGVELDSIYNVQLHVHDVEFQQEGPRVHAFWRGRQVSVLHFSGAAKKKYPKWQGLFSRVPDPVPDSNDGDGYAIFLDALRAFIGRNGLSQLAWSFYGLTDGENANVRDSSTFPLFAALHYLVRSNGCVRVLETGTARGYSAACLASAVAHRENGRVVTLDPYHHPGRHELWSALPARFREIIEERSVDSLEGMQQALDASEQYEALLFDSLHTAERIWDEFQLGVKLCCPGGLIMVHDAIYAGGTVSEALTKIEQAGYNVVRLWTAEGGIPEDDHLGLAVIENRIRN